MRSLRTLAVVAAALIAGLAVPAPAQAADVIYSQAFAANSGDACVYGATDGTLYWRLSGLPLRVLDVNVKGRVLDRPLPSDPGSVCGNDGYLSIATFTAYAGNVVVDRESRRADNGVVTFDFTLVSSSSTAEIDRISVVVCRTPSITLPPSYCGATMHYRLPNTTP